MAVELELAVVRGRDYLARAVFRPDAVVTLGSSARVTVRLAEPELPEHLDLLTLTERGARLRFDSSMQVELQVGRELRTAEELREDGLAWETPQGWEADLPPGSKGVLYLGGLRVLLKLQAPRGATIWSASQSGGAFCGGCSAPLPWAVAGPGALTPCRSCGDLNRVEDRARHLELGATAVVRAFKAAPASPGGSPEGLPGAQPFSPTIPMPSQAAAVARLRRGLDPPTFDAIEARRGADLPTFDAIEARRGADLPTFDAIEARRGADLPTFDGISVQSLMDPDRERTLPPGTDGPAGPAATQALGPSRGAELPTFDAISVIKQDQALSTQAAMGVMRQPAPSTTHLAAGPGSAPGSWSPPAPELEITGSVPAARATEEISAIGGREPLRLGAQPTPIRVPKEAAEEARSLLNLWESERLEEDGPASSGAPNPVVLRPSDAPRRGDRPVPRVKPVLSADRRLPSEDQLLGGPISSEPGSPASPSAPSRPPPSAAPRPASARPLPTSSPPRPAPSRPPLSAVPPPASVRSSPQPASAPSPMLLPPLPTPVRAPPLAPPPPPASEDGEEDGDYDDFLMGLDDGGIGARDRAGWLLIAFGLISGLLGVALILYVTLQ